MGTLTDAQYAVLRHPMCPRYLRYPGEHGTVWMPLVLASEGNWLVSWNQAWHDAQDGDAHARARFAWLSQWMQAFWPLVEAEPATLFGTLIADRDPTLAAWLLQRYEDLPDLLEEP
jgi:hypothetical protein